MTQVNSPRPLLRIATLSFVCALFAEGALVAQLGSGSVKTTGGVEVPADPYAAVTRLPAQPAVEDGHPVVVVDAAGEPMAGVSVVVVDTRTLGRKRRRAVTVAAREKFGKDGARVQLSLLALHGKRYVTDAEGATRFARVARGTIVAIKGRTLATTNVILREGREPRSIKLTLKPPAGIDVVVVDYRGRPVRNVTVRQIWRGNHGSSSWGRERKTDRQGFVRLDPLDRRRASDMDPFVEVRAPTKRPVAIKLDPETFVNDPSNPLKLQLPPHGMVRVYVVDDKKRPVKGIEHVYLRGGVNTQGHFETYSSLDVADDYATFPIVEVGLKIEVWCQYRGQSRPQRAHDDGPRHPMDMRVVTLSGVTAPAEISFKLVDQKGEPVKGETIGAIFAHSGYMESKTVETTSDGSCRVVLSDRFVGSDEGFLTITRRGPGQKLKYLGAARVSFDRIQRNRDLGRIALSDETLLVEGRVVDRDGKPVQGVHLSVPTQYRWGNRGGTSRSGPERYFGHSLITGRDGRFEFREYGDDLSAPTIEISRWSTSLGKSYYLMSGSDPELGAKDHRVVVGLTSSVSGSVAGIPKGSSFPGQIEVQDENGGRVKNLWVHPQDGGSFKLDRCPPGNYTIVFKLSGSSEPFHTVKGVKVEEGVACADPRLQGIDISKHCKMIRVTVLRPDKKPAPSTTIWTVRLDKNGRARGAHGSSTDRNGTMVLAVPIEGANLSVTPRDGLYQVQNFEKQKEDLTVVLKPGWQFKFKVTNMPKLPAGLRYQVSANPANAAGAWGMHLGSSYTSRYLDDDGKLEMWISTPGVATLTLYPVIQSLNNQLGGRRANNLRFDITIDKKNKAVQEFEMELDENALAIVKEHVDQAKGK